MSKETPEGWVSCKIGEATQIVSGGTPPSKDLTNFTTEGGIPWITPADLSGYKEIYISRGSRNLSEKGFWTCSATKIPQGSVLFSSRAPVGYVAIAANELTTNQGFKSFVLPEGLDSRFVYFYLKHIKPVAESMATGTTFKELSGSVAAQLPLAIAPFNEQKRIADKLDSLIARVDACRNRLDRVPRLLNRFRQAVLAAAISGELTKDWRTEINRSLDSWQIKHGSDAFSFITSGSRGWAAYYTDRGAKFLRVGNLNHNTIELDLRELQHVNPPSGAEGERTRIQVGDILISITADVGMVAFVGEDIGEAYINQHLCLARQTGEYSGAYLAYYLASPLGGLGQLTQMQRGVTKAGLTLRDIRSVKFLIPELDEQDEIVRRIESLFSYANLVEVRYHNALVQVERLIPLLLQKAFHGELVPQDPNDVWYSPMSRQQKSKFKK